MRQCRDAASLLVGAHWSLPPTRPAGLTLLRCPFGSVLHYSGDDPTPMAPAAARKKGRAKKEAMWWRLT